MSRPTRAREYVVRVDALVLFPKFQTGMKGRAMKFRHMMMAGVSVLLAAGGAAAKEDEAETGEDD